MTLGTRLRNLRIEKGIYQKTIAELLDVGISTISGYEKDLKKPKPDNLLKLANFYGVTTDYLLGENVSEIEEEMPEGVQLLRIASQKLSLEDQQKLFKLMETFING